MNSQSEMIASLKAQGHALLQQHHLAQAKAIFNRVCAIDADDVEAWYALSNINGMLGDMAEAGNCSQRVLTLQPEHSEAHLNLGNVLCHLGKYDDAILHYKTALRLNSALAALCNNNLGILFKMTNRLEDAIRHFREAVRLNPNFAEAHSNLGNIYTDKGFLEQALESSREAVRLAPHNAMAHNNLGKLLKTMGRNDDAIAHYHESLRLNPNLAEALNNMGNIFLEQSRLEEALAYFQKALRSNPTLPLTYSNLGIVYTRQGKHDEALRCFQEALRLDPQDAITHSSLLFLLCYRPDHDLPALFLEHVRWGDVHGRALEDTAPHTNQPVEGKRLRLGYVSADFRIHPVGFFIEQILAHHDKDQFEVYCYSNKNINDDITAKLRHYADHWRDIAGIPDEAVARHIRRDGIDILVDLSGHTSGNRLLTLSLKPAPIQATWMGYPATTGLNAIDYIIANRFVIPPQDECYYVEQVVRLPNSFLCFTPPQFPIEVSSLPALSRGQLTFGCFNNIAKLTPKVIAVWAKVLHAIPDARLLLKSRGFDDEIVRSHFRSLFAENGIPSERLEFAGSSPGRSEVLAAYHEVDIGLDPFPYNGTTTTVEALWMGVPVISIRGDHFVSRVGDSILNIAGLGEYVVDNEQDYITKAMSLAADLPRLAELRSRLRTQMLNSSLCDGPGFTRDLETAYRNMWLAWCRNRNSGAAPG